MRHVHGFVVDELDIYRASTAAQTIKKGHSLMADWYILHICDFELRNSFYYSQLNSRKEEKFPKDFGLGDFLFYSV